MLILAPAMILWSCVSAVNTQKQTVGQEHATRDCGLSSLTTIIALILIVCLCVQRLFPFAPSSFYYDVNWPIVLEATSCSTECVIYDI